MICWTMEFFELVILLIQTYITRDRFKPDNFDVIAQNWPKLNKPPFLIKTFDIVLFYTTVIIH